MKIVSRKKNYTLYSIQEFKACFLDPRQNFYFILAFLFVFMLQAKIVSEAFYRNYDIIFCRVDIYSNEF